MASDGAAAGPADSRRREVEEPGGGIAASEQPAYLPLGPEKLYTVFHSARTARRGKALLAGPFPSERIYAYNTWVRWARHLALEGFDVLRFDYRGVGESTGPFEAMGFERWHEDLEACRRWLERERPGGPLAIHGLRFGALLAARAFTRGMGDLLLLWDPPSSGKALLLQALRKKLAEEVALNAGRAGRSRESYIAELQNGAVIEVDGYRWSWGLYDSIQAVSLDLPGAEERRPWKALRLEPSRSPRPGKSDPGAMTIPSPPFWAESPYLAPDLSELFLESSGWLRESCSKS